MQRTMIPKRFTSAGHEYDLDEDAWLTAEAVDGGTPELRKAWSDYAETWRSDLRERLAASKARAKPLVGWTGELPADERRALVWLIAARRKFDVVTGQAQGVIGAPVDRARWDRLMAWRRWAAATGAFASGQDPAARTVWRHGPTLDHLFWLVVRDRAAPEAVAPWFDTSVDHVIGALRYGLARMVRVQRNVTRHDKMSLKTRDPVCDSVSQ